MIFFNGVIKRNFIIFYYYVLLSIKISYETRFIDIKKIFLYDSTYFVVLNTGLFLYNFDTLDCAIVFKFLTNINENDKIILKELEYEKNSYIFCLVRKSLFIFNSVNNVTKIYTLDIIDKIQGYYYDLLPYRIDSNNISFILTYNKEKSKLSFYYYNFFLKENVITPKIINIIDMNIIDNMISCQIYSYLSVIKCFYYNNTNHKNYLSSKKFIIENMNIIKDEKSDKSLGIEYSISQIKSVISYNNNSLVCYTVKKGRKDEPSCYFNYHQTNEFKTIGCHYFEESYRKNYRVLYFNETKEFMFVSSKVLATTILNSFNASIGICNKEIFSEQTSENSIIYYKGYKFVNVQNFTKFKKCNYISENKQIFFTSLPTEKKYTPEDKNEYHPNFIKEYTNKTKYEVFRDIEEILKNRIIGVNYEIEGKDFVVTIKPTNSTFFDNRTKVDFDECEQRIRQANNISNSSILSFFQMEIDNKEKNSLSDQIKYFTFDDQKKILDLSICEDIYTKIHFTIKNNTKIDISSISDFKDKGIDIMDIKDEFFNDLCYSYSDSKNDIILEDRIKYLYQNYSLCESECIVNNIDFNNMTLVCNCKIQGNDNITYLNLTPLFFEQPKEISFFDSNIGVARCYKLVFSMTNKLKNIGFILFSILFIIYLIFIIFYCINGIKPVTEFLYNEMIKKGYLNKISRKFFEDENIKKKIKTSNKRVSNPITKKSKKKKKKALVSNRIKAENHFNLNNFISINTKDDKENPKINSLIKLTKKSKTGIKKINKEDDKDSDDMNNFGIIKINLNDYKNYTPLDSNQSLHNYTFDEAIKYDRRNIFRISYIYLLSKQIIFRTFLQKCPLEIFPLRFTLFIFMLSCDLALNALFYFNDNISKKYHYAKNLFLFTFSNNITIIIYSTLLSYFLITLLSKLSNSSNAIRNVFTSVEQKIKFNKKFKINEKIKKDVFSKVENILRRFKVKIIILFIIETILILFFAYFVTAFCHVYSSTQTSWLLDSFLSILSRLIIELIFAFLYGKLYQVSVGSNFKTLYKAVICLYDFS